jgi:phosphatidylglycerol---prolipoprotein diacylglyceryl transferase
LVLSGARCMVGRRVAAGKRGIPEYAREKASHRGMITVPTASWTHVIFDGLAWTAGLATSVVLYRWRLRDAVTHVAGRVGPGYFVSLVIGAMAGAWLSGSFNTLREAIPALSHSIAGALVGAIVGVECYKAVTGIRGSTGVIFVGSLSVGIAIGRWGCLFAGLPDRTYGTPTGLPWGVDLGDGISRHPVQIYESLAMWLFLAIFLSGLQNRRPWALHRGFYVLCAWYGLQRFAWEFLKPYPPLIRPLNIFHILSLGLVIYGCIYAARDLREEHRAVSVSGSDHQLV